MDEAREQISRLHTIATELYDQVQSLLTEESGAITWEVKDEDRPHVEHLRADIFQLKQELAGRGAIDCPEPMKSAAAERMRTKLEAKLLPKINADIPKWAERLRFIHAAVLK